LEQQEIRTHYSGSILFAAKLITVGTGIVFALTVANSLVPNDYGAYGVFVNLLIPYFALLSGPVAFWTMRFVARGKEGAIKTGIVGNLAMSIIATLVYFAALPLITASPGLHRYVSVYIVVAAQIIETYLITVFEACLQATRPQTVGYGLLVGEILKVVLVYLLVIRLQLALLGALLSVMIAFAFKSAFYIRLLWKELKQRMVLAYVKEWLQGSAFNLFNIAGNQVAAIIFIMLTIYGGTTGYGYYYAAVQIANIITYSTFLAFALTPKLLSDPNIDEATTSLKYVLMFAIPMTAGVLALPSSYLAFFKPPGETGEYTVAAPVLMILAADALVTTVSTIFTFVLYGIEKVDEKSQIPFRQVAKSRLFIAFSLPYFHSAITLPTAFYALTNLAGNNPLLVAAYVTGINAVARLASFVVLYSVLRRGVKIKIPWKNIGKYVAASLVMALALLIAHLMLQGTYREVLANLAAKNVMALVLLIARPMGRSTTLIVTATGGSIYIVSLILIDKEIRGLARSALQAVARRFGRVAKRFRRPRKPRS
jgi:O-antigen/teichoic acid export membrane protein